MLKRRRGLSLGGRRVNHFMEPAARARSAPAGESRREAHAASARPGPRCEGRGRPPALPSGAMPSTRGAGTPTRSAMPNDEECRHPGASTVGSRRCLAAFRSKGHRGNGVSLSYPEDRLAGLSGVKTRPGGDNRAASRRRKVERGVAASHASRGRRDEQSPSTPAGRVSSNNESSRERCSCHGVWWRRQRARDDELYSGTVGEGDDGRAV